MQALKGQSDRLDSDTLCQSKDNRDEQRQSHQFDQFRFKEAGEEPGEQPEVVNRLIMDFLAET